jgi:hypothetical protein
MLMTQICRGYIYPQAIINPAAKYVVFRATDKRQIKAWLAAIDREAATGNHHSNITRK